MALLLLSSAIWAHKGKRWRKVSGDVTMFHLPPITEFHLEGGIEPLYCGRYETLKNLKRALLFLAVMFWWNTRCFFLPVFIHLFPFSLLQAAPPLHLH